MRVAFVSMETIYHRDADQEIDSPAVSESAGRSSVEGLARFHRVATDLAAAGHDVTVYCTRWWDGHETTHEADGLTYRAVTVHPAAPSFCTKLPYTIARDGPDLVHVRPRPACAALAASVGTTIARVPLVVEWFGDEGLPDSWIGNAAATRPDVVITPSEMVRTGVRERGATGDGSVVIPESIDVDRIQETEPVDKIDIVYAHHLDESANVESLFLGLAELRGKDWAATIVGDGPMREDYEQQARNLRIEDRVEFAGACDRDERIALYRGAHVFVQTAYQEYFATELLWALACGCVGIVEYQTASSAHELIEGDDRGFRVTSTQQMAGAIVDSAGLEYKTFDESYERHDHDAVREKYETVYERLLADRGLTA